MNILKAILNISKNPPKKIGRKGSPSGTAHTEGQALEEYIRNVFAGVKAGDKSPEKKYSKAFSYRGAKNNPPDLILRGGEAIEVKKQEGYAGEIQLNSSHPKDKLYCDDPKIKHDCKGCEESPWRVKDMVYIVGVVPKESNLKHLSFIYGDCYAADKESYLKVHRGVKEAVQESGYGKTVKTNEIAQIRETDPLARTNLRVRGMWCIENPLSVFSEHYTRPNTKDSFGLMCIMTKKKFESFPEKDQEDIISNKHIDIKDVKIKNPKKLRKLMFAKLITYKKT